MIGMIPEFKNKAKDSLKATDVSYRVPVCHFSNCVIIGIAIHKIVFMNMTMTENNMFSPIKVISDVFGSSL